MPLKVEKRKLSSMPVNICKEKAASFYLQVMTTDNFFQTTILCSFALVTLLFPK